MNRLQKTNLGYLLLLSLCLATACTKKADDNPAPADVGGGTVSFNVGSNVLGLTNVVASRSNFITIDAKAVDNSGSGYGGGYGGGTGSGGVTYPYLTLVINATTAGTYTVGTQCNAAYQPNAGSNFSANVNGGSGSITISSVSFTKGGSITGTFSLVLTSAGGTQSLTNGSFSCSFSN